MTVSTYYFDAHTSTSDPNSAWTSDANAFDGNTGTSASVSTSSSSNYLRGDGTTATSITDTILSVQVRVYGTGFLDFVYSLDGFSTTLYDSGTVTMAAPTSYITLPVPSGGWTLTKLQNLSVKFYSVIGSGTVAKIELSVAHSTTYARPVMVANTANLAAATAAKYWAIQATSDTAWGASDNGSLGNIVGYCQISSLEITLATAPGSGVNRIFTVYKNGAPTTLTVTISGAGVTASDTTDIISFVPGDQVVLVQTTSGGAPVASTPNKMRMKIIGENNQFLTTSNGTCSATALRYLGIQSTGGVATTAAAATQYMAEGGTLKNFYWSNNTSAISSGAYVVTLYKNGSSTSVTFTIDSSSGVTVQSDTSSTVTYAAGDYFYWVIDPTAANPNAAKVIGISCENVPSTAGHFALISSSSANIGTTNVTKWNNWYGDGAWDATAETDQQAPAYPFTLTNLYAILSVDTGASKSRVFTFRKNTADTSATVTFNNSGTIKTWSGSVSIASGDLVNMNTVASGTPTNSNGMYTLIGAAPTVVYPDTITKTHTTDALKRKATTKTHTTDANKKKATTKTHTTDANKKVSGLTRTHTTDSFLRKQFTKTHTTDANKKQSNTLSHTTDANKREVLSVSHTTDAYLSTGGTSIFGEWSDIYEWELSTTPFYTRTHTTDALKRKSIESTHTTDANKKKADNLTHTTDALIRKANVVSHATDALKRTSTTLAHTTDSLLRKQFTKTHTTDAMKHLLLTISHTTDSLLRKTNTVSHTTDANKRKAGITLVHTTDANRRKATTVSHTTDSNKRKQTLATHTTDALIRKTVTLSHTTDSLLRKQVTKTHTTDALKRKTNILSHSTDANKRKATTVTHTTDANRRKVTLVSHTTDSFLRGASQSVHSTDANKRKALTVSHTTDASKFSGSTVVHTTDTLLRATHTVTHSTDANKRKAAITISHTTNSFLRIRTTVSHSTDALKRKALSVTHTTDANKKHSQVVSHTTDSKKRKASSVSHSTDAMLKQRYTLSHSTDSNLKKSHTFSHTTDANKKRGQIVSHNTDSNIVSVSGIHHTTDSYLHSKHHIKKILVNGVWVYGQIKILESATWKAVDEKYYDGSGWVHTYE